MSRLLVAAFGLNGFSPKVTGFIWSCELSSSRIVIHRLGVMFLILTDGALAMFCSLEFMSVFAPGAAVKVNATAPFFWKKSVISGVVVGLSLSLEIGAFGAVIWVVMGVELTAVVITVLVLHRLLWL